MPGGGTYHPPPAKHLPAYSDEVAFRSNNRAKPLAVQATQCFGWLTKSRCATWASKHEAQAITKTGDGRGSDRPA